MTAGIMDCKKARRLFDDLADGRLAELVGSDLQRHIADCTDCRVLQQRAARLQRLLALKRYEQPSSQYSRLFLSEFHRRLEAETRARPGWWEQFLDSIIIEPARTWPYGFAGAAGIALAVGVLIWSGNGRAPRDRRLVHEDRPTPISSPSPVLTAASVPAPHSLPRSIAATLPRSSDASSAGSVVIIPAAARDDASAPRYVLDRITVTPASYEVASVHF